MDLKSKNVEAVSVNTIRGLAMDAVEKAASGHPGTAMALAPVAYTIFTKLLRHNPDNPAWPDRDRFVLSAGHACMLQYAMLHLTGYDLTIEDLKNFRQWGSRTPGHPEHFLTPGVETTTGPLGQGFANGVGMAIAERYLAGRYNRIGHEVVDHHTYAICSDGDVMEGVAQEAASIAGQHALAKLVYVYDDNHITIDGSTAVSFDGEDKEQAVRGPGLARPARRGLRGPRGHRGGPDQRPRRGRTSLARGGALAHRLPRSARRGHRGGPRQRPGRGRGEGGQGGDGLRPRRALPRLGRGLRAHGPARVAVASSKRSGTDGSPRGARSSRSRPRSGTGPGAAVPCLATRRRCRGGTPRRPRSSPPARPAPPS